jgi:uncharacterized protein (DUF362 family)
MPAKRRECAMTRRLTRRTALGMLGTAAAASVTGCGILGPGDDGADGSSGDYPDVAIIQGPDIATITREAIQAVGGMEGVIDTGDKVFIKANWLDGLVSETIDHGPYHNVTAKQLGMISDPTVLVTVAEECLRAGASQVIIGDTTMYGWHGLGIDDGVAALNRRFGYTDAVRAMNLDYYAADNRPAPSTVPIALAEDLFVPVPSPNTNLGQRFISKYIVEADKVLCVPVLKTHHDCCTTLSIKNFQGSTSLAPFFNNPPETRYRYHTHQCEPGVEQAIVDILLAVHPVFAVIDATIGMEGEGVHVWADGKPINLMERYGNYFVIASRDLLAADATAARMIGMDPLEMRMMQVAYASGLGRLHESDLKVLTSDAVPSMHWQQPRCYPQPQLRTPVSLSL